MMRSFADLLSDAHVCRSALIPAHEPDTPELFSTDHGNLFELPVDMHCVP
jgi:hypothetical protein